MKKLILYVLTAVFILVWTFPAMADVLTETENKKKSIDNKIDSLGKKKQEVKSQLNAVVNQKNELLNVQKEEDKEYRQLLAELEAIKKQIDSIDNSIKESEEDYNKQKDLFEIRLKVMYENSNSSFIETLFESKNLGDFLERLEIISVISKKDRRLIEELDAIKKDIEFKKSLKEEEKGEKQQETRDKQKKIRGIKVSRAEKEKQIRKIKSKLEWYENQEDELIKQAEEFNNIINNLVKNKGKYAGGIMKWPVPGSTKIVSFYGMRTHPIFRKKKMHYGIDIDAEPGAAIVAANQGMVILAGRQSGYGNTVIIDHGGGITTLYAHCSRLLVRTGDYVKAGHVIARVGSTGLSTGPHLHFEIRKNGSTINPLEYVGQ